MVIADVDGYMMTGQNLCPLISVDSCRLGCPNIYISLFILLYLSYSCTFILHNSFKTLFCCRIYGYISFLMYQISLLPFDDCIQTVV